MNLEELFNIYNSNFFQVKSEEISHIHSIKRFSSWSSKNDQEKLEFRKLSLKMLAKNFQSNKRIPYYQSVIDLMSEILNFLEKNSYLSDINLEKCTEEEKYFFRIYNMFWCEKEYIFFQESLEATKVHISVELLKELFSKIENTSFYVLNNLDEIKDQYEKMIYLFSKAK